jgi:3'-5' exonuclease
VTYFEQETASYAYSQIVLSLMKQDTLPTTLQADESNDGLGTKITFERIIVYPDGHREIEGVTPKSHVDALGAPHCGERSERELIEAFVQRIAELSPQLITFNGNSFDLPVLRYRALVNKVSAPGLAVRPYFNRYTEDAVDLCDVLSAFNSQGKATLHEICRVMGLPGKPGGMDGSEVAQYHREGRIKEIADYCESDVVNTYRVWLRYELFRGKLKEMEIDVSEQNLRNYIKQHSNAKPHLTEYFGT